MILRNLGPNIDVVSILSANVLKIQTNCKIVGRMYNNHGNIL